MRLPIKASGWLALLLAGFCAIYNEGYAQTQVSRTKHNLTPSGPGTIKTAVQTGLCVFCHTPHNASPSIGMWNHELSGTTYQLYASSTLKATLNQPTGSSQLCLSCHDGTLALDTLRVPPKGTPLTLSFLTGGTVLGTNLSRDHPISFTYDLALTQIRQELADPSSLPVSAPLDPKGQLQCTSCHDPHEDRHPNFLRADNRGGTLCTACHRLKNWSGSIHATSNATWNGTGTNPWPPGAFDTVTDNACYNCHRSHGAASPTGKPLLAQTAEATNCTICHGGTVALKNVEAEFSKPSHHPVENSPWTHESNEDPLAMTRHVACTDCHNPHVATAAPAVPPSVPGALLGAKGLTFGGSAINTPNFEYEVCDKCHNAGVTEPTTTGILRQSGTRNVRRKIDPTNRSYHPIAATGVSPTMPGLQAGYTTSSIIGCTSCHNNDDWTALGTYPRGPHGSRYAPILGAQYSTGDPSTESPQTYALCYQCHNESFLITDSANTFPHQRHVVNDQAPCAACHDAHGSRQNAHLIDFMLRDSTGKVVVSPSATQHLLTYTPLGSGHAQCYLSCHGWNHEPSSY
jgi:predicted CXXCH cytochrome family protein